MMKVTIKLPPNIDFLDIGDTKILFHVLNLLSSKIDPMPKTIVYIEKNNIIPIAPCSI